MLTYPTAVARVHAEKHAAWIRANLAGFHLPTAPAPEGEEAVLRNFSTEWTNYEWTGESYWSTTPEHMLRWMQYALGVDRHPLRGQLVLEVGIGIGGIADSLTRAEDCEIVGVDLSYAVDQARRFFGKNDRLHIVQASAFALPFRRQTFDTVYSQGVLHHTFSTCTAFDRVVPMVKPDGMLYVWLYSKARERESLLRRVLKGIENVVRPVLARLPGQLQTVALLPAVPLYLLYQNVYRRRRQGAAAARYGFNEALHAARDRLTPPFAHRHTYEEVARWFAEAGYQKLEMLRDEMPPEGVPETMRIHVGIRGFNQRPLQCAQKPPSQRVTVSTTRQSGPV
jgi:2-polyprenyl-3-methyl-5-hydroxy-6-metoxy-1,4-benzoquinol methylase